MTASEQIWFAVGIGGFLLVLEESFTYILKRVFSKKISPEIPRVVAGVALVIFALYKLFTLPSGT